MEYPKINDVIQIRGRLRVETFTDIIVGYDLSCRNLCDKQDCPGRAMLKDHGNYCLELVDLRHDYKLIQLPVPEQLINLF